MWQWEDEQKCAMQQHCDIPAAVQKLSRVTMAPRGAQPSCWSPAASTRWHHIMFSPLHFLVSQIPLSAAGWLEGMNQRGRADPAHSSFSPHRVSCSPPCCKWYRLPFLIPPTGCTPRTQERSAGSQKWELEARQKTGRGRSIASWMEGKAGS